MRGIRHHHGRKNSQLLDNCSRFVQSTQMRVQAARKRLVGTQPGCSCSDRSNIDRASSSRLAKKWPTPIPISVAGEGSRGLRRNAVSRWEIAKSGFPAHNLSHPLRCQPYAKLGLICKDRSTRAMAASMSSPK